MTTTRAALVAAVVVALVVPAAVVAPAGGSEAGAATPETDNTVTRVAVTADGDARWTVRIRTRLATDEEVEQYRAFQEEFRSNTSRYLDPFADRMRGVVADAGDVTGREMAATDFAAETSVQEVPRRWGVVSFSFTWTNFARAEGDRLVVGDVFDGGFFLAANDSLVVAAPEGYVVEEADPAPEETGDATATWVGREDFADGRPRVVLAPAGAAATPTATPVADGNLGVLPPGLVGAAGVGLLVTVAAAAYLRRQGLPVVGGGPDAAAAGVAATGGGDDPDPRDPDVPLTDAERVERLLADNGGRMKQAAVADELDWSASKTSRVVGDMVEEDRVEKLRIGRENVLDLQG